MHITDIFPKRNDQANLALHWLLRSSYILVTLLWFFMCWPWLVQGKLLTYDASQQFYPDVAFTVLQIKSGEAPWWNPYIFGGFPQIADPQAMTLSPSVILPLLIPSFPSPYAFAVVVMLHLLFCALGAVALARSYRWQPMTQIIFALCIMAGGVAASRLQHTPMTISYVFLPWLIWGMRSVAASPSVTRTLVLGILGGLCGLQLTQVVYLFALLLSAYSIFLIATTKTTLQRYRAMTAFFGAALIALIISAPQWLSTLAFLPYTNRTILPLEDSVGGAAYVLTWVTLFVGNFFSSTRGGVYWGQGDVTTNFIYISAVPVFFWLMFGWVRNGFQREERMERWFWLLALTFFSIYSLGTYSPTYEWLYYYLPGVKLFRRPVDSFFLVGPIVALLAMQSLDLKLMRKARLSFNWILAIVMVALLVGGLLLAHESGRLFSALRACMVTVIVFIVCYLCVRGNRSVSMLVGGCLVLVTAADIRLTNLGARFNAYIDDSDAFYGQLTDAKVNDPNRELVRKVLAAQGDANHVPFRYEHAADVHYRWKDGMSVHRVASLQGYSPMVYAPYSTLFGYDSSPEMRYFTPWLPGYSAASLDLLGLRAKITNKALSSYEEKNHDTKSPAFTEDQIAGRQHLWINPDPLPRILNPTRIELQEGTFPDPEKFTQTDFVNVLWLPGSDANVGNAVCSGKANIQSTNYQANKVSISYRAEAAAWLVLNEIFAPGWRAAIDGKAISIHRGNGLFRAVCAPAGSHQLTFSFTPWALIYDGWSKQYPELRQKKEKND